jgi:hypothetical protein
MTCNYCNFRTCTQHRVPWHSGRTCEQYDWEHSAERRSQEGASEQWKTQQVRLCTECNAPIQKNGGCNWVLCTKCKSTFDWTLAKPYLREERTEQLPFGDARNKRERDRKRKRRLGLGVFLFAVLLDALLN